MDFEVVGDVYRFNWPGYRLELDRLHEEKDGLVAEVTVSVVDEKTGRLGTLQAPSRFNLSSPQTRTVLENRLQKRDGGVDWPVILDHVCTVAPMNYRRGEPIVRLKEVAKRPYAKWLREPFLERNQPSVFFGRGGSGKTFLVDALAVEVAAGVSILGGPAPEQMNVLYLDWEADGYTHKERAAAICNGRGIEFPDNLYYRRQAGSLAETASFVRTQVAEMKIGFVIIDSLGMAKAGEMYSPEASKGALLALRSCAVTMAFVDHLAKNGDKSTPIGSVYTENIGRLVWQVEKAQEEDSALSRIALTETKGNNWGRLPKRGYELTFIDDPEDESGQLAMVLFHEMSLEDMPEFFPKLDRRRQLRRVLLDNRKPMTVVEISESMGVRGVEVAPEVVKASLNFYKDDFKVVGLEGKYALWGLLTHREQGAP